MDTKLGEERGLCNTDRGEVWVNFKRKRITKAMKSRKAMSLDTSSEPSFRRFSLA
jgi:hypothetical protein